MHLPIITISSHFFLQHGPSSVVGGLSNAERARYGNQTVPTFLEVLELAKRQNRAVMFDLFMPETSHPYYNSTVETVLDIIAISGINGSQVHVFAAYVEEIKRCPRIHLTTSLIGHPLDI